MSEMKEFIGFISFIVSWITLFIILGIITHGYWIKDLFWFLIVFGFSFGGSIPILLAIEYGFDLFEGSE